MNTKKYYSSPNIQIEQCVLKKHIAGLSLPDVEIDDGDENNEGDI